MDMRRILQTVCAVAILSVVTCEYGDDGDYGTGSGDYDDDGETVKSGLENELVEKAYGSAEKAEEFWRRRNDTTVQHNCALDTAWAVDDIRYGMEETNEIGRTLTDMEREKLLSEVEKDIDNILQSKEDHYHDSCIDFFHDVRKSRKHLDCAFGRNFVTGYFADMSPPHQCFDPETNFTRALWIKAVHTSYTDNKCSELGVYRDIVYIAQIAKERYKEEGWDRPDKVEQMDLLAQLARTISTPKHGEYLSRISCGNIVNWWECGPIVNQVATLICGPLEMVHIKQIEELVKGRTKHPMSSPDDMVTAMEILNDVTSVVDTLSHDQAMNTKVTTMESIKSYLEVMDNYIGEPAASIWNEMPDDESSATLQMMLVNNEKHLGGLSTIFLRGSEPTNKSVKREAMEMKFSKVEKDKFGNMSFEFEEAQIQADMPPGNITSNVNVYAIHYKSWAELLQKQGLKELNSTSNKTKTFVGKGGIVSLSVHADEEKKSVPVIYKMNFDKAEIEDSAGQRRVCASCEYLDVETGEWRDYGCVVKAVNNDGVTCSCNHTTNFAAFMSPAAEIKMTPAQYQAKQIVSYIGSAVSVLALAISLVIFNIVRPTVRNDRLKAHMNLAFALFVVHAIQLTVDFAVGIDIACLLAAIFTHFFLLASFFWMLIEGIFLYLYVVQVFVHSTVEYLKWVYLMGWLLPAVIVAISAGIGIPNDMYMDHKDNPCEESEMLYPPDNKYDKCWLSTESGMSWSFIAPALIIILINTVILTKVIMVLVKVSGRSRNIKPYQARTSSSSSVKKDPSSGYSNKMYGRKEPDSPAKYQTSDTKSSRHAKDLEANYGSTAMKKGKNVSDSPSRFDNRVPSQAYMHNHVPASKLSPGHEEGNGKHFIEDVKAAIKGALVLLPILGIPWICGLWIGDSYVLMMIFLVLNSTQGLVIFVVYCLMNGEVKRALQRHMKVAQLRTQTGRSRTSSTSSLRSLNRFGRTWRTKSGSEHPSK